MDGGKVRVPQRDLLISFGVLSHKQVDVVDPVVLSIVVEEPLHVVDGSPQRDLGQVKQPAAILIDVRHDRVSSRLAAAGRLRAGGCEARRRRGEEIRVVQVGQATGSKPELGDELLCKPMSARIPPL